MPGFTRIVPFILIVFVLAFSVRLSEVITGVNNISSSAFAKAEESPAHEEKEEDTHDKMAKNESEAKHENGVEIVEDKAEAAEPEWKDASDSDIDISGVKMDMLKDVAERRKKLDDQEKSLIAREALLKATEQELDRKLQELTRLQKEIEGLLNQQSEEEEARIDSLVKIYEGMKPKDAARIFDTLDIDVLVLVMSKMSERKVAPVLAAMSAERARTVTIMLAEQKKLPTLR